MRVKAVVKNDILKSQLFYFIALFILISTCMSIQSTFLTQIGYSWFHIDLVSIIIVYLCLEHHIIFAALQAIIAGCLLQVSSSSPHVFFILYFMLVVVFANLISGFFVINSLISKIFIFSSLYLIKYILFYFSLNNRYDIGFSTLIFAYWKEFFSTIIISFFFYQVLMKLDSFFIIAGTLKKR